MTIDKFRVGTVPPSHTLLRSGTLYDYAVPNYQVGFVVEAHKKAKKGSRLGFLMGPKVYVGSIPVRRFIERHFSGAQIKTFGPETIEIIA